MAVAIDPRTVVRIYDGDTASMGESDDHTSKGRIVHPDGFFLVRILIHFNGGTGTAAMTLARQEYPAQSLRTFTLDTTSAIGTGTDLDYRVTDEHREFWWFSPTDTLMLTWANPDAGNMLWSMCAEIVPGSAPVVIR